MEVFFHVDSWKSLKQTLKVAFRLPRSSAELHVQGLLVAV